MGVDACGIWQQMSICVVCLFGCVGGCGGTCVRHRLFVALGLDIMCGPGVGIDACVLEFDNWITWSFALYFVWQLLYVLITELDGERIRNDKTMDFVPWHTVSSSTRASAHCSDVVVHIVECFCSPVVHILTIWFVLSCIFFNVCISLQYSIDQTFATWF